MTEPGFEPRKQSSKIDTPKPVSYTAPVPIILVCLGLRHLHGCWTFSAKARQFQANQNRGTPSLKQRLQTSRSQATSHPFSLDHTVFCSKIEPTRKNQKASPEQLYQGEIRPHKGCAFRHSNNQLQLNSHGPLLSWQQPSSSSATLSPPPSTHGVTHTNLSQPGPLLRLTRHGIRLLECGTQLHSITLMC